MTAGACHSLRRPFIRDEDERREKKEGSKKKARKIK
jgi:hypothetical protein